MDSPYFIVLLIFIIPYIFVCNEVAKAAKENSLPNLWSYFVISFLFSPITGLLFILVRKGNVKSDIQDVVFE